MFGGNCYSPDENYINAVAFEEEEVISKGGLT